MRRRTIKVALSAELSIEMTEMLEFVLPIFSASNLFFYWYITDQTPTIIIISFVIGVLHAALPMQEFNELIFKLDEPEPNNIDYMTAS